MTGKEIQEKINFNNKKIGEALDPSTFVLQEEILDLMKENDKLREKCPHKFENNKCIYCGQEKS